MPSVLVSGASIAGPTVAYWLGKAGFDVTVVERAPAPRPGGQAIDIRGPALTVIREMGLLGSASAQRTRFKGMSTLDNDGKEIDRTEERTFSGGRFDSGDIEILRDLLAGLLLEASTPLATYVYDDSIAAVAQDEAGVDVIFERGAPRRFDIVIGADGVHSHTRRLVFGDEGPLTRQLGVALAIFTTPNLLNLTDWQVSFRDPQLGAGYVIYPARDNTELRINLGFGLKPGDPVRGDVVAQKALVASRCARLGGDIPRVIEAMHAAPDFYFGSLAQVRMESWSKGRVTLVGDAAYCPTPFTGQGTSLAMIGAFVLAKELAHNPDDPGSAFARCEERMRPFVRMNQDMLSLDRQGPIPDEVFDKAKNGIVIKDLIAA
ncbi:MAG TPA: FAD-dependent monooxygenase [Xanthobacteraceae bacterium]|jgi:2-polyprenyl-6-methoxyphenol hydroxylase-like FAD-dependent oxidoreductase